MHLSVVGYHIFCEINVAHKEFNPITTCIKALYYKEIQLIASFVPYTVGHTNWPVY